MSQQDDSKNDRAARLPKSKAAMRRELEQATEAFLHSGGEVNNIPVGISAWEPGTRPPPSRPLFAEPPGERTPVPEVVATIEARREALKQERKPAARQRRGRARRKVIYDDFGEPLRHVWVDD
jgi:hypothetical protein